MQKATCAQLHTAHASVCTGLTTRNRSPTKLSTGGRKQPQKWKISAQDSQGRLGSSFLVRLDVLHRMLCPTSTWLDAPQVIVTNLFAGWSHPDLSVGLAKGKTTNLPPNLLANSSVPTPWLLEEKCSASLSLAVINGGICPVNWQLRNNCCYLISETDFKLASWTAEPWKVQLSISMPSQIGAGFWLGWKSLELNAGLVHTSTDGGWVVCLGTGGICKGKTKSRQSCISGIIQICVTFCVDQRVKWS